MSKTPNSLKNINKYEQHVYTIYKTEVEVILKQKAEFLYSYGSGETSDSHKYFAMRYYQMKELTSWHGGGQIWLFIIEQIANRGSLYMNILIAKYLFILNSINHAHYLTFTGIILMHEIKQNKSMALQNKHNFWII